MIPVKTVVLAAALSIGTTMAVAQESGAGEKSTAPTHFGYGDGYSYSDGAVIVPAPSWRVYPRNDIPYQAELGDSIGTTAPGYMNQEAR